MKVMTTPDYYKTYIENIVYKPKDLIFKGELFIRKVIGLYDIKGTFLFLQFNLNDCYLYECETDSSRFRIKSYNIYCHKLCKIFSEELDKREVDKFSLAYFRQDGKYVYDEYYSQLSVELAEHNKALQQALSELPNNWKCSSLYIDGDYCDIPSVVYALQRNAAEIISMKLDKPLSIDNNKVLKCWFPDVVKGKIKTDNNVTFLDCLKEPQTVFVPLDDNSLDSFFYNEIKWRDILPNFNKDCEIAGVECKTIMLKTKVDGFQNVFCRVTDIQGNNKFVLIYNALNIKVASKNELLVQKHERKINLRTESTSNVQTNITNRIKEKITTASRLNENRNNENIVSIKINQTGYNFTDLFSPSLKGAKRVILEEPHLSEWYQQDNLEIFLKVIARLGTCKTFVLKTRTIELDCRDKSLDEKVKIRNMFDKKMKFLCDNLRQQKIKFIKYEITNPKKCHDRNIYADSGCWTQLGYGLHFLKVPSKSEQWIGGTQQEDLPAIVDTTITYHFNFDFDGHFPNYPELQNI